MANYATNLFYAETQNGNDLKKVEDYLEKNFCDCYVNRLENAIDCEFSSKWIYPEEMIDNMLSLLKDKNDIYIRVLTHELCNEYVSFRVYQNGKWDVKC
ncbi:MAG TPA: hypothetical protein H9824_08980 [Candidatus Bacteroides pullicola]|uniref:Uncharacterized protein n=1 Tax=Candidatus Bacteroides pullicola TaxID=2838475 RepID=A0A9D1ZJT0_9BACE|nr:hypothetical protein [Candidatus Bacteroides pullicola]